MKAGSLQYTILVIACLIAAPICGADPEPPLINPPSDDTRELILQDDGSYHARIAVTTPEGGPKLSALKVNVFDVHFDDGQSTDVIERLNVEPEIANDVHGDALVVTIAHAADDILPGKYTATLHAKMGNKTQPIIVTLSKRHATVLAGPTVRVERLASLNPGETPEVIHGKLRLTEESRFARLSALTLSQAFDVKTGASLPQAHLRIDPCGSQNSECDEDEKWNYSVGLDGALPPGTYTGKITVRSPQLAAPLQVDFEVVSRRSRILIFICAVVGVFAGWFVRIRLKSLQEHAEALIIASDALRQIRATRHSIQDETVRQPLDELIDNLRNVDKSRKVAEIKTAAETATKKHDEVVEKFNKDKEKFDPSINELKNILTANWNLPPAAEAAFNRFEKYGRTIQSAYDRNDVTQARKLLQDALRGPALEAVNAAIKWRHDFADYLAVLESEDPPLGKYSKSKLADAATTAKGAVTDEQASVTTEEVLKELNSTHGANVGAHKFFDSLRKAIDQFLSGVRQELDRKGHSVPTLWENVESAAREVSANVEGAAANQDFVQLASDLHVQVTKLKDSLDAVIAASKPPVGKVAAVGVSAIEVFNLSDVEGARINALTIGKEAKFIGDHEFRSLALIGSLDERLRLRSISKFWEFIQSIVVAVFFIFGAYALNYASWTGSWEEMVVIFVLAFGVDLTAEGLVGALKR